MSKLSLILVVLLLVASVTASPQPLLIVHLHYDTGTITLLNQSLTFGYLPDRTLTEGPYRANLLSRGTVVDTFTFREPNVFIEEGTDETGKLSGGKVRVEQMNFALVLPYYPQMDALVIVGPEETSSIPFQPQQEALHFKVWLWGMLGVVLLFGAGYLLLKKKR